MLVFLLIAIAYSQQVENCYTVMEYGIIITKYCSIDVSDVDVINNHDVITSSNTEFNVGLNINRIFILNNSVVYFNNEIHVQMIHLTLGAKIILNHDVVSGIIIINYDTDFLFDNLLFNGIISNGKTITYRFLYLTKFYNYARTEEKPMINNSSIFIGNPIHNEIMQETRDCKSNNCILTIEDFLSYVTGSNSDSLKSKSENHSESHSSSQYESHSESQSQSESQSEYLESSHLSQEKSSSVNIPEPEPQPEPEINYFTLSPICIEQYDCLVYEDRNPANCLRGFAYVNGYDYPCFKPYGFDNWFYIKNNQIWIVPDNTVYVINNLFLKDLVGTQFNVNTRYTPETNCFYVGYQDNSLEKLCTSKYTLISNSCFRYTRIPNVPLNSVRYCVGQTYNGKRLKFVGQSRF